MLKLPKPITAWAEQYPNLCTVSELGRSYENRPIWLLTITDQSSGAAEGAIEPGGEFASQNCFGIVFRFYFL
ncbi:MAG: hypothetical protein OHK0052_12090 [Anaerolineales bacterium]